MNGFEYGFKRAFVEIIGGIVTSIIVTAFTNSGLLDPSYVLLFNLLNVFGIIMLLLVMPYWGITYLMGWLFGLFILLQSGLIGILEFVIYLVVSLAILIIRIKFWLEQ